MSGEGKNWPPVYDVDYAEIREILEHVRVMRRFLSNVIEPDPELRPFYDRISYAYGEVLRAVLAPYALSFAEMLVGLEDHYTGKGGDAQK